MITALEYGQFYKRISKFKDRVFAFLRSCFLGLNGTHLPFLLIINLIPFIVEGQASAANLAKTIPSNFRLGLQGGLSLSWLNAENRMLNPGQAGVGTSVGLSVSWPMGGRYTFQSGILLKSNTINASLDSFIYKSATGILDTVFQPNYQYRTRGIELPFLIRLGSLIPGANTGLYGLFGFTTSWNFGVRARFDKQKDILGYDSEEFFYPENEQYRPVNLGGLLVDPDDRVRLLFSSISIGGGWAFQINPQLGLDLGIRMDVPISQAFKGDYLKGRLSNFVFLTALNF